MTFVGDLRHSCNIITLSVSGYGASGKEIIEESEVSSNCLFIQPSGTIFDLESGERSQKKPQILLPPNVSVNQEKKIRTTEIGWTGTYKIISVNPLEDRYQIIGFVCDIEVING